MILGDDQATVVRMLEMQEEAMSELYKEYARQFPKHADTWRTLALAEIAHADWIRTLRGRMNDGSVHFSEKHAVGIGGIHGILEEVSSELARAKLEDMLLVDALSVALHLEKSMIERDLFKVFEGDSPELTRVLESLAAETQRHVDELEKLLGAVSTLQKASSAQQH